MYLVAAIIGNLVLVVKILAAIVIALVAAWVLWLPIAFVVDLVRRSSGLADMAANLNEELMAAADLASGLVGLTVKVAGLCCWIYILVGGPAPEVNLGTGYSQETYSYTQQQDPGQAHANAPETGGSQGGFIGGYNGN